MLASKQSSLVSALAVGLGRYRNLAVMLASKQSSLVFS